MPELTAETVSARYERLLAEHGYVADAAQRREALRKMRQKALAPDIPPAVRRPDTN